MFAIFLCKRELSDFPEQFWKSPFKLGFYAFQLPTNPEDVKTHVLTKLMYNQQEFLLSAVQVVFQIKIGIIFSTTTDVNK